MLNLKHKLFAVKRGIFFFFVLCVLLSSSIKAQYNIQLDVPGLKDSVCYLVKYTFNYHQWVDTAKVKNGKIIFKGNQKLNSGLYLLAGQARNRYFDFIINNEFDFSIKTDTLDFVGHAVIQKSKENQLLFSYLGLIKKNSDEFMAYKKTLKGADSTALMQKRSGEIDVAIRAFQKKILSDNPLSFIKILLQQQTPPQIPDAPLLENGKKDSTFAYRYYKAHYWDGIDLSDERNLHTPFFYEKVKKYVTEVIVQHPDSVIKGTDKLIAATKGDKEMFKHIVSYTTNNGESSKIMGMDAVFVSNVEKYYKNGKAFWVDSTSLRKIINRADILKPLLLGNVAPDLQMIDTTNLALIEKMGFLDLTTSEEFTKKYYENVLTVQNASTYLNKIKAKYLILVFWKPTCGHCKEEIPKIKVAYDKLVAEGVDIKTFAVLTEDEYKDWKKFIRDNQLNWINVCDPAHLNNINKIYDIYSTPVIYILDEQKRILAKRVGAEQLEEFIKADMKKK